VTFWVRVSALSFLQYIDWLGDRNGVWVGIIWNNSFLGGLARAEVWTPASERDTWAVALYCTWRLSALTTVLHGQVSHSELSVNTVLKRVKWRRLWLWLYRRCKWFWWLLHGNGWCRAPVCYQCCWQQLCVCANQSAARSGTIAGWVTSTAASSHVYPSSSTERGLGSAFLQHDDSSCRQLWWSSECECFTVSRSIGIWLAYQWYVNNSRTCFAHTNAC